MKTDTLRPLFYANDDGHGTYVGLVPITRHEVSETARLGNDTLDFWSRLFYLWVNPTPPVSAGGAA